MNPSSLPASTRAAPRVLALVQAGADGGRLEVLTRQAPAPALPFAGSFRLIDVCLSNLRNSGIQQVWVSDRLLGQQPAEVLGTGEPWGLDRQAGGLRVISSPEPLSDRDAVQRHGADAVLVLSADQVYRLDYAAVVAEHLARGAECTVVTVTVPAADAGHRAVLQVGADHRVLGVEDEAVEPTASTVATGVVVYDPQVLAGVLGDLGTPTLAAMVERGRTFARPLPGYWRDLGRPETYLAAHRDLLRCEQPLFDQGWPLLTARPGRAPARLHLGCSVADSMIADGCEVFGSVRNSVLGPGVVVEAGGQVRDSVVFADVTICPGATVDWSVVGAGCTIGGGARVGNANPQESLDAHNVALIGAGCRIEPGAQVPRGSRLEPGSVAD